jgi:hypothetical protein
MSEFEEELVPQMPIGALTAMVFKVNELLDRGEHLDYDETCDHIRNGDLFDWLSVCAPAACWSIGLMDRVEFGNLEDLFERVLNAYGGSKFGVERNGLCLVLAFATQGIQDELQHRGIRR